MDHPTGTGPIRVQFVASQLVGVIMARYIVGLEPFASTARTDREDHRAQPAALPHRRTTRTAPAAGLRQQPLMLIGIDVDSFVDEQNRNPVIDSVCPAQTRVVEQSVADQQQSSRSAGHTRMSNNFWSIMAATETAAGARLGRGQAQAAEPPEQDGCRRASDRLP